MDELTKLQLLKLLENAPDDSTFSGWDDGTIYMHIPSGGYHADMETGEWVRFKSGNRISISKEIENFNDL